MQPQVCISFPILDLEDLQLNSPIELQGIYIISFFTRSSYHRLSSSEQNSKGRFPERETWPQRITKDTSVLDVECTYTPIGDILKIDLFQPESN